TSLRRAPGQALLRWPGGLHHQRPRGGHGRRGRERHPRVAQDDGRDQPEGRCHGHDQGRLRQHDRRERRARLRRPRHRRARDLDLLRGQRAARLTVPGLSQRIRSLKGSSTVAFNTRAKELAAQGVDVIAMTAGEPDFQPPQHVLDAARDGIAKGLTKYTASEGTLELRRAVVAKFQRENGLTYATDEVMVSTGGKQVLYNGFMAVLEPGDEVVMMAPYWVSYPAQVQLAGGVPVVVPTSPRDGFIPDLAAVAAAITPRTKVLLLNSPSNPTGAVYPPELVEGLAALAARHGLWLFAHVRYALLGCEGECTPVACFAKGGSGVIHGASKGSALTGWRIASGAGPKELIAGMNRLQGQSTSG